MTLPPHQTRPRSTPGLALLATLALTAGGCDAFWEEQDVVPETTELVSIDLTVVVHALLVDGYEDYLVPNADVRVTASSMHEKEGPVFEIFDEKTYEVKTDIYGSCLVPVRVLVAHPMDVVTINIEAFWEERTPWYRGNYSTRFTGEGYPSAWTVEMYLDTLFADVGT